MLEHISQIICAYCDEEVEIESLDPDGPLELSGTGAYMEVWLDCPHCEERYRVQRLCEVPKNDQTT